VVPRFTSAKKSRARALDFSGALPRRRACGRLGTATHVHAHAWRRRRLRAPSRRVVRVLCARCATFAAQHQAGAPPPLRRAEIILQSAFRYGRYAMPAGAFTACRHSAPVPPSAV